MSFIGSFKAKFYDAVALIVLLLTLLILGGLVVARTVSAFDYPKLLNRSLAIGSTVPGATTDYTFSWRYPSPTTVRSVKMIICADPYVLDPCSSTPASDFSAGVLSSQSGDVTGFSILSQTANEIVLTRPTGPAGAGQSTYVFENMVNPTGLHSKFFVQIFTYSSADASGTPNHISSVANATVEPIVVSTIVPPILYFCVGLTVDEWCENSYGNFIDYGDLRADETDAGTSQFGVATNAVGGYTVTINGGTMASGNKLIEPLSVPAGNSPSTSQFGLNLRANTDPALGQDVFGAGIGVVAPDYDSPDLYKFSNGDTVATAATGSLFNTYTATYIVNVPPDQPSGIYTATIAYICTAAF